MTIKWNSFSSSFPRIPFPFIAASSEQEDMVIAYGPKTKEEICDECGFFPTHWIYVNDLPRPGDTDECGD